jgi:hypothetical protein
MAEGTRVSQLIETVVRDETTTGVTTTKPAESAANIGRHSAAVEKYVYQDGSYD